VSPRPYWKGYLKLSLVSCPIALHAACSSTERICFRQINRSIMHSGILFRLFRNVHHHRF
jgi:non-homologous end joining protein Ku